MNFRLLLVSTFILCFALPPLSRPVPASLVGVSQEEVFHGTWQRRGTQDNGSTWTIELTITPDGYRIDYPSIPCGGELTLLERTDTSMTFREKITRGRRSCNDAGVVQIHLLDQKEAEYVWFYPGGRKGTTGRLSKKARATGLGTTEASSGENRYTVRMYNVDHRATLYINGIVTYKARWGHRGKEPGWEYFGHRPGDSQEIDITDDLRPRTNTLRFTLWNVQVCCYTSLTIDVVLGGEILFHDSLSRADSSSGTKYDKTITINMTDEGSPKQGWASETNYHNAATNIRRAIVGGAKSYIGSSSGQSEICRRKDSCWLTDTAGAEGKRIALAIQIYRKWSSSAEIPKPSLTETKKQMTHAFHKSNYGPSQKAFLIYRIMERYASWHWEYQLTIETDDQVLRYLGVRRQCFEWAVHTAIIAGGKPKSYAASKKLKAREISPGMGYYYIYAKGRGWHAMIIIDVYYDAKGTPKKLKVAESNWSNKWVNPIGDIPWQRVVTSRVINLTDKHAARIADYES
jgi:hypothetical protein